ncbi:MAG: glycosyltransferase family 39 protein [Taibaiella sp.]|nr:glycosyltransferase family 39 protein [Taibaiella sp.]
MSKNKHKQVQQQHTSGNAVRYTASEETKSIGFKIPYPVLLLVAAVFVVYFSAFSFGYTELDDTIFIKEFRAYNEDIRNLITAFTRGLFDAVKDPYYRPLFSDVMILNYQVSGDSPAGYHFVNVLLHVLSVVLLFRLCSRLGISKLHSFLLALIFAVHPVLAQAVAWIPGRNDTMLAVFVLSFFLQSIEYAADGKTKNLLLSGLFLLLAYFTKETAVFAAPAAFMFLVLYRGISWNSKEMIPQYVIWIVCFGIWYLVRHMATIQSSGIGSARSFEDFIHRLPVIIHYIGKIVLPFNQSVFPTQQDTVVYYGIAAAILLLVAVLLHKTGNRKAVLGATGVFILFLMPALLVPDELNQQTFEHRLYLPMLGLLLLLPQTILLQNKLSDKQLTMAVVGICVLYAALNIRHQQHFESPLSFWSQAVESSPNSAYANMMLAARLDKSEGQRSEELFRKAYALNPKEKYLNFYMAEMLQKKDSVLASEPYLLAEKKISDYVQCDFYMARVALVKNDKAGAIVFLQQYLKRDRYNPMANNNLLLLLMDMQRPEEAKGQASRMRQMGMDVPPSISRQLGM